MSEIRASRLRMIGFSLPALGLNTLVTGRGSCSCRRFNGHRGFGAAAVGFIFFLAKIIDMIAAPMWGVFMDSYSTRWGRRRPWLALSVPILVLAILMVYNPPESVSALYLFGWLALLYIGWDAWTISHTSWALELSRDYDRRSRITGLLQVMVMIGGIMISLVPAIMERVASPTYPELVSAIAGLIIVTAGCCVHLHRQRAGAGDPQNRPHLGIQARGLRSLFGNFAATCVSLSLRALLTFGPYSATAVRFLRLLHP